MDETDPIQPPAAPIRPPLRKWKQMLRAVVILIALVVLGLVLVDLRARTQLKAYKARLIAKGEKLTIADHIPKLPPAISNAVPELMAAPRLTPSETFIPIRTMVAPGRARVAWRQPQLADWGTNIWPAVFAHLASNQVALTRIRIALQKPDLVFDHAYHRGLEMNYPHLEMMRLAPGKFAVTAVTNMRQGNEPAALDNLLTGIRLITQWREPLEISQYMRSSSGLAMTPATWELLQWEGWNDRQLSELQLAWQGFDVRRDWLAAAEMGRAWVTPIFTLYRSKFSVWAGKSMCSEDPAASLARTIERKLDEAAYQSKINAGVMLWWLGFSHTDEHIFLHERQSDVEALRRMIATDNSALARPDPSHRPWASFWRTMMTPVARMHPPQTDWLFRKVVPFETSRRLIYTAVALHRHRLKHGEFPASLDALVPEFLAEVPRDFMDGQPLRYRRRPDGQFLLWSVGENLKDDGGNPLTATGRTGSWLQGLDWVWPQAASQNEVDAYHAKLAADREAARAQQTAYR